MNQHFESARPQFEVMPFGAGGSQYEVQMEEEREVQMEEERAGRGGGGARGGRGGRGGGGRPPPNLGVRPPGKPPGRGRMRRPAPWPAYPAVAWPWPRWGQPPYAPDAGEPFPAPGDEPFDDGTEGEASATQLAVLARFPPALRTVLLAMPDAERPRYTSLGRLPQAVQRAPNKPGLYVIVFTTGQARQAYNGQSSVDVRARLQKHLLCATMLGLRPMLNNHEVFFANPPRNVQPRAIELKINRGMLTPANRGVLTNQRHEIEVELLGEAWL